MRETFDRYGSLCILLFLFVGYMIFVPITIFQYPGEGDLLIVSNNNISKYYVDTENGIACSIYIEADNGQSIDISKKYEYFASILHALNKEEDFSIGYFTPRKILFIDSGNIENIYKLNINSHEIINYHDSKSDIINLSTFLFLILFFGVGYTFWDSVINKSKAPNKSKQKDA
jgi:hypothetical protein